MAASVVSERQSVTASAQPLPDIQQQCRFVSAFFNVFTQVDLGELTHAEAIALLTQPSA